MSEKGTKASDTIARRKKRNRIEAIVTTEYKSKKRKRERVRSNVLASHQSRGVVPTKFQQSTKAFVTTTIILCCTAKENFEQCLVYICTVIFELFYTYSLITRSHCPKTKNNHCQKWLSVGSGCGTVDSAVASDTRGGPGFDSSIQRLLLNNY